MTDTDAELRALQSRAYGRDADITRDPEAMRRLASLEAQRQPASTSLYAAADPSPDPLIESVPRFAPDADGAPAVLEPDSESMIAPSSALRERFSPRPRLAWFVAAVAVFLSAIGVTATAVAMARPAEPGVVATIPVDPEAKWRDILGSRDEGSAIFEDFHGVTLIRSMGFAGPSDSGVGCLIAVSTKALNSASPDAGFGGWGMGCPAGGFPASIQFIVDDGFPDALRARYPTGTALKFTMRGNLVEVRADTQGG
ncbi:hypothetical protein RAC69_09575 [Microbacterium sp. LS_15]|uniref:hypothetical protein n=1 Tax=Microbacterium sp. LS_15 TaxID=3055790 RepID=UPI0035BFF014